MKRQEIVTLTEVKLKLVVLDILEMPKIIHPRGEDGDVPELVVNQLTDLVEDSLGSAVMFLLVSLRHIENPGESLQ